MKNVSRFYDHPCPNCTIGLLYSASSAFSDADSGTETPVPESLAELAATAAFKADLKAVKKAGREASGAITAFKKAKATVVKNWRDQIGPTLQTLKQQKKDTIASIIALEENRKRKSKWAKFLAERKKLLEKHSISLRKLHLVAPEVRRLSYRRASTSGGLWIHM